MAPDQSRDGAFADGIEFIRNTAVSWTNSELYHAAIVVAHIGN